MYRHGQYRCTSSAGGPAGCTLSWHRMPSLRPLLCSLFTDPPFVPCFVVPHQGSACYVLSLILASLLLFGGLLCNLQGVLTPKSFLQAHRSFIRIHAPPSQCRVPPLPALRPPQCLDPPFPSHSQPDILIPLATRSTVQRAKGMWPAREDGDCQPPPRSGGASPTSGAPIPEISSWMTHIR